MSGDGFVFRDIEERWPIFKEDHNVRLSMAIVGVNSFGDLITSYSMWPKFVINNNLPRM